MRNNHWRALAAIALIPTTMTATADIVTLDNGKELRGLTRVSSSDPNILIFTGANSSMNLNRSRIRSIQQETEAKGYIHIGLEQREAGQLAEALHSFQKALDMGTDNEEAQKHLDNTQRMIKDSEAESREEAVEMINDLINDIEGAAENKDFEAAEALVAKANELIPENEQKPKLQKAISSLYLEWAADRADKFDKVGQEEKLMLALAADPENSEIIDQMLTLWEDDPEKKEQVANVYEVMLERNPGDEILRAKLASLYNDLNMPEDAVRHDLQLYEANEEALQGSALEERLLRNLNKLHRQYAGNADYDKAIYYAKVARAINPEIDPTDLIYYGYMKELKDINFESSSDRLKVGLYAAQNGLEAEALNHMRFVLGQDPENAEAMRVLTNYATRDLQQAN